MSIERSMKYAEKLSLMIQKETISEFNQNDKSKFYEFHSLLKALFPNVFRECTLEDFQGSILLKWKGVTNKKPIVFMNHHDVVEAPGEWKFNAFSGKIDEDKVWGRGALDTKGGLFCMLQAADELITDGFLPDRDIYFESACNEETDGAGCDCISNELKNRNIEFSMCLDEGGMMLYDPIGGADGTFAMVGVGEKGTADIKFIARGNGGHASTPGKDTPLVRLGKFMAAVDGNTIFDAQLSPVIAEMLKRMAPKMKAPLKNVMSNSDTLKPLLTKIMPAVSNTAGALLRTTIAFTMAGGSDGTNVLPQEAWVIGNMRFSHHQGREKSIEALKNVADKYNIEIEVLDPGFESPISDFNTKQFKLIENAVSELFPDVITSPYIMTGASDSRFMSRVCENCYRFTPFLIDEKQLESIHGLNENVNISCLAPAVDFYKKIMRCSYED